MDRVDDADSPPRNAALYCLSILKIWIHPGALVNEPEAQMLRGVLRVALFFRELPRGNERRNLHAQSHEISAMVGKVIRVRHAVALSVRTVRVVRVRPPVIALREEVVRAPGAAGTCGRSDGDGLLL